MDIRLGAQHRQHSGQDTVSGYAEVETDNTIDLRPRMPLLGVLVVSGAFLTWVLWQELPHELIEIATPFFCVTLVISLIVACESKRCVKCNTIYRRVDVSDPEHPHQHLVVCDTCKTYFRSAPRH